AVPDSSAPVAGAGAAREIEARASRGTWGSCGWVIRLAVTGNAAQQIRMATTVNGMNDAGSDRPNNCCPTASAPRLTAMYTANTWLRLFGGAAALSQLSITVYRPTSAMPVTSRNRPHATGDSRIACSSTADAVSAA